MTIWTLGDAVVDLLPRDNMQFEACAGGAPFNVAIGVARLGRASGFIGRVGNDTFGRFLHQTLETAQVDTGSLEFDAHQHTSTVLVSLAPNGERQFEFWSIRLPINFSARRDYPTLAPIFCTSVRWRWLPLTAAPPSPRLWPH